METPDGVKAELLEKILANLEMKALLTLLAKIEKEVLTKISWHLVASMHKSMHRLVILFKLLLLPQQTLFLKKFSLNYSQLCRESG